MKKIARKIRGAAKAAPVVALLAVLCGCASTGEQPARSQTQQNEFNSCMFYIVGRSTNEIAGVEIFTQTQQNEGSETIAPTATPTNTTTTDLRATIPAGKGGGGSGVLETIVDAATRKGPAPAARRPECPDGNCMSGGECANGNCSE